MTVGARQEIELDQTDTLSYRLLDEGASVSGVVSAVVEIFLGTTSIVSEVAATWSDPVVSYSRTWDGSTFTRGKIYRAKWVFRDVNGDTLVTRMQYFQIVRRAFRSQVADSDITALDPGIGNKLGAGSLVAFRNKAWRDIQGAIEQRYGRRLREHDATAGDAFFPGDWFDAHITLTRMHFYQQDAFDVGPDTAEWTKYQELKKQGEAELEQALSRFDLDLDSDLSIDAGERDLSAQVRCIR